jgi:PAS domain S-box-containing protein
MDADFLQIFDDFGRRYWPLLVSGSFLVAWLFHWFLFRQQMKVLLGRYRKHQITDRKRRAQLLESEERLRTILASVQTGVTVVNPSTREIEFVNPVACGMFGVDKNKLVGRCIEEFEVKDSLVNPSAAVSAAAGANMHQRELLRENGERFPVLEKVVPITINKTVFTMKSYLDLTELDFTRKQVERLHMNLTKRVQELHCLFGVSGFLKQLSLTLPEVVQKVVNLLPLAMKYPHLAVARLTLGDFVAVSEPFDVTSHQLYFPIEVAGKAHGAVEVCYLDTPPDLEDDEVFSREEHVLLETIAGRLSTYLETQQVDQDRAMFKGLMDATSDPVFLVDSQTEHIIYVNIVACRLLGLNRVDILAKDFSSLFTVAGGFSAFCSQLQGAGVGEFIDVELSFAAPIRPYPDFRVMGSWAGTANNGRLVVMFKNQRNQWEA